MKKYISLTVFIIVFLSDTYAQAKVDNYSSREFTKLSVKAQNLLDECVFFNETVGVAAGIYKNGKQRWLGSSGFIDRENNIIANDSMKHRIASIAKPMTAIAILQLYEQNKLSLNDPIQKYLPYFPQKEEGEITIEHLLHHTSGLKGYLSENESFSTIHYENLKEAIATFMDRSLLFKPGSEYSYTTYGYVILGAIVEKASGETFRDYMKENIWDIAGMRNTDIEVFGSNYENKSKLYKLDANGNLVPDMVTDLSLKVPGGGFYSTIDDLLKFGNAILEHKLIQASTFDLMIKDSGAKKRGNPYAMGWFLYGDKDSPTGLTIGHSGSQAGTSTQFMIYLDKKVVVVVLSNTSDNWPQIFDLTNKLGTNAIDKSVLKAPIPSIIKLSKSDIENIVGLYVNPLNKRFMNVFVRDEKPYINVNGMRSDFQLYPTSTTDYFVRWGDISYTFSEFKDGIPSKLILSENEEDATYERTEPKKSLVKEIERLIYSDKLNVALDLIETNNRDEFEFQSDDFNVLGLKLVEDSKWNEAITLYEKYTSLFPEDLRGYELLGASYLKLNNNDLALENFKKSADLYEGDGFYQMALNPPGSYKSTVIPTDTTKLFEYRGNLKNKEVFLFLQGGPDPYLSIDNRRDPLYALPNQDDILRVYPYQSQMLNNSVFSPNSQITEKDATFEREQSAEIIYRTVDYFKKQGKKVHVFAHSFGSQLILEYLQHKENNADNIIFMGAKLDNNPEDYPDLEAGKLIRWKNGVEPFVSNWYSRYPAMPLIRENFNNVIQNTNQLVTVHRKKKFTKLLSDKYLKNVVFVHAKFDEASGRQTKEELSFLQSKGVTLIGSYGDHHSMLSQNYMANFYFSLINETEVKPSLAYKLSEILDNEGSAKTKQWIEQLKNRDAYFIDQNEINSLGYEWLQNGKTKEAIEIFKINVQQFPYAWNVYDSLGEAYMADKQNDLAIKNYKKSLELNPDNQYGINALQVLIPK